MTTKETRVAAIDRAIERGGGIVRFSAGMGVTHQAIYSWKRRGWMPLDKALIVEHMFGIPRAETVNPDIAKALQPSAD